MDQIVVTKNSLAVIEANIKEVRLAVTEKLKEYEIEVTVDNIAEARTSATELNKMATSIDELRKKITKEHKAPIDAFNDEMRELFDLVRGSRAKIIEQTAKFEDAQRLEIKGKILEYLAVATELRGLREEYRSIDVTSAVTLTALTSTGALNKRTKDAVDHLVSEAHNRQIGDDLAAAEKLREKEREEAEIRLKIEAAKRDGAAEAMEQERKSAHLAYQDKGGAAPAQEEERNLFTELQHPLPKPKVAGKSVYTITATFQVTATAGASGKAILDKIIPMIEAGKLKVASCKSVEEA